MQIHINIKLLNKNQKLKGYNLNKKIIFLAQVKVE
jgi:hypothetical protein